MKGNNRWNYKPYAPLDRTDSAADPFICRIAPGKGSVEIAWIHADADAAVYFAERGSQVWEHLAADGSTLRIGHLKDGTDYRIYVESRDHRKSMVRLARTGEVPGTVVQYLHPDDGAFDFSGRYLCSPSILRLPGGRWLASADIYGPGTPQNLTMILESDDNGSSWRYRTDLFPCFWGKLFMHRDSLYMLGTSTEYGDLLIGKSDDEGRTWSEPAVIARGSCHSGERGFHKAPVPVIHAAGRLWTAVEYGTWAEKRKGFADLALSIDENACLLDAEEWTLSEPLPHDNGWSGALAGCSGIEGNMVEAPDESVRNILRYAENQALMLRADAEHPERPLRFDRFIRFPMGHTKFEIRRKGDIYVAVGNRLPLRNILSVYKSRDLISWEPIGDILDYGPMDMHSVAFQYPSFEFDGDGLAVLSRTAWNCAHNFHDSNYITFHRFTMH